MKETERQDLVTLELFGQDRDFHVVDDGILSLLVSVRVPSLDESGVAAYLGKQRGNR